MRGTDRRRERRRGAARERPKTAPRPFLVRPMEERDLAQVAEVEKDAFPTQFPPTAFRRELRNPMSRCMVLARTDDPAIPDPRLPPLPYSDGGGARRKGGALGRLMAGARQAVWRARNPSWQPGEDFVAGYVCLWLVADEAHIVAIGARTEYRGMGLGELLLIAAMKQALAMESGMMTLEARVSNHIARNLYEKYGFTERGVRKGYYSDNREDAVIMTVELAGYAPNLRRLAAARESRWGRSETRLFGAEREPNQARGASKPQGGDAAKGR